MRVTAALAGLIVAVSLVAGLTDCESSRPQIPTTAELVGEGTGQVAYRAPSAGRVYVYDKTWNQLVYAGQIDANQLVQVDPATGRTTVDNQVVVEKTLGSGDQFKIYFESSDHTVQTTTIERTQIERHTTN